MVLISIRVAISPTVINSVTFNILLLASISANSSSDFCHAGLFYLFLYFAPLDLFDLPWSFSSVSRICFWTSSSEGSSFNGFSCLDFKFDDLFFIVILLDFFSLMDLFVESLLILSFSLRASSTVLNLFS